VKKSALRFTTILILSASFSVISGVLLLRENLQRVLTLWGESLQMTVYLAENVTAESTAEIATHLKNNDQLDKIEFVSSESALKQFGEQMASYAPDLLNDTELQKAIPSSFQFSLNSKIEAQNQLGVMQEIAARLKLQPGVEDVSYGQEWVKSYAQIAGAINWSGYIFAFVIIGCAVFVISNCIQSSIHQRREEIEVLELVGATPSYIRRPFLIEGLALCGLSCLAGLAIAFGFFLVAQETLQNQISFLQLSQHIQFLKPQTLAVLILGSLGLGWIATGFCLRSINDGWAASRRKQTEN
jgi:cell division transport system permease protein